MWTDVVEIRDFYASPLGQVARRLIHERVRALWPDVKGARVLGIGYATPFLHLFRGEAERVMAVAPPPQGVLRWPADGPAQVTLCDEAELPFPDLSIDRILIVHALECTEQMRPMMREVWRVLSGSGRVLVVVPNRRGLWARFERTPFGQGRPYSPRQLKRLLRETMFTPLRTEGALWLPPLKSRMVLSAAAAWEQVGRSWFTGFPGVVMAEAAKEIYAAPLEVVERRRAYLTLPGRARPTIAQPRRSALTSGDGGRRDRE